MCTYDVWVTATVTRHIVKPATGSEKNNLVIARALSHVLYLTLQVDKESVFLCQYTCPRQRCRCAMGAPVHDTYLPTLAACIICLQCQSGFVPALMLPACSEGRRSAPVPQCAG